MVAVEEEIGQLLADLGRRKKAMEQNPGIPDPQTRGSTKGWIVSFLLFPYGPFIYMAKLKVITKGFACFAVLASAMVHSMISVLIKTNGNPWQHWLVILMGIGFYLLGTLPGSLRCGRL